MAATTAFKMTDLKTVEECDDALQHLTAQLDEQRDKLRELRKHRDALAAQESAAKKFAALSPAEQEAIAQHISSAGAVKSGAAVGTPGK